MASSKTQLANLALRHLGISLTLANLDSATERSDAARAVRDFYDQTLDEVLRDFDWPFARRTTAVAGLAVVAADPTTEWAYSYRVPGDCLAIRRVLNGTGVRTDTLDTRTPWELGADDDGPLLYTDYDSTTSDALRVRYTARVTDITRWAPDAAQAFALLLASYIASSVTRGDELKLGERALQRYLWRVESARANAANEGQPDQPGEGALLTARY